MNSANSHFIQVINTEFLRRKKVNHRYSLRGYAHSIGIDPSLLSKILAGKHIPSLKTGDILSHRLKLQGQDRDGFLKSIISERYRTRISRLHQEPGITHLIPVDIDNLPLTEQMISDLIKELSKRLESAEKKEAYQLLISLIPLNSKH